MRSRQHNVGTPCLRCKVLRKTFVSGRSDPPGFRMSIARPFRAKICFLGDSCLVVFFFFSSRRRHTRFDCDWSSDVCSSDLDARWRERWARERTNEPDLAQPRRPFHNLMMFPYPSAEGLHVGNMFAFTGADIYGRFKRLHGYDVFEPIGFDAFGIHSENYALSVGTHPAKLIPQNIETFRRQLRRFGGMFDWRHELSTTDPRYYKWTQWIFLQLFKAGIAFQKKAAVNWCPKDMSLVANEQVINGFCERHPDTKVEQRFLEQWFFKITRYVERLLRNLDQLDWSDSTRTLQR